ncbi:MAG TPA: circadian clock KaiB family protein [Steroidobacteraceae bacterium]|nr:circadian clock KaiB family protein [Steroidobacteraceae bacterium]
MSQRPMYKFRLFVAADTLNSAQAASNLNALCKAHLAGRHEIEVIDVFKDPKRALAEGIRMTPTLLKLAPGPVRRIVGTLADVARVMQTLGLDADAA